MLPSSNEPFVLHVHCKSSGLISDMLLLSLTELLIALLLTVIILKSFVSIVMMM